MADWPILEKQINSHIIATYTLDSLGVELTGMGMNPTVNAFPNASEAIFIPFRIYQPTTVTKAFVINGASAAGAAEIGIYDAEGVMVVTSSGASVGAANALREYEFVDTNLAPGNYYMGMVVSETATSSLFRGTSTIGATMPRMLGVVVQSAASPLPATATFVAASSPYIPFIHLATMVTV